MTILRIVLLSLLTVVVCNVYSQVTDALSADVQTENASKTEVSETRTRSHIDRFASKGYFGIAEFNFGFYEGKGFRTYGVDIINGYRTSPWFAVGIGVGARYCDFDKLAVPFYIHLRTDILDRKVTPYFAANIGGAYMEIVHFFIESSCGIGIRMKNGRQVNIGLGPTCFLSFGGALGFTISTGFVW